MSGRLFRVIDNKTGKVSDIQHIALNPDHDPDNDFAAHLCWCDMDGFLIDEYGDLYLADECGAYVIPPEGRFKVVPGEIGDDK